MPTGLPKTLEVPNLDRVSDIKSIKEWLRQFTRILRENYEMTQADIIVLGSGDIAYLGDSETNGSWRLNKTSTQLLVQRRESGTWETKWAFDAS